MDNSIVYYYPSLERHLCGYCKSEKGNICHGMWAKELDVEDYQNLIDRGWRRSGHYCYKPIMDEVCCPMYTIRCDALNFQLSKSQKKVIKKFNKFLTDGQLNKNEKPLELNDSTGIPEFHYREAPSHFKKEDITNVKNDEAATDQNQSTSQQDPNIAGQSQDYKDDKTSPLQPKSGIGADPNKPPCKKAKLLRLERKQEKLLKRGMSLEKIVVKNEQKSIEEFLNDAQDQKHRLKLELISMSRHDEEWERLKKIEFALYKKYQTIIHNDPPGKCTMEGFLRFLVKSPLQHVKFTKDSDLGFGSFHQLYWLDDKLIAVGVIDILPKCVSAVYFFYDPDYRSLTLGTYGSLREVELSRSLHQKDPSIKYYYMGYYIHSCPKMRYKGKLKPSYLLCPETYYWVPFEKSVRKLEVVKYSKLEDDEKATDSNTCSSQDIDGIKIWNNGRMCLLRQFKKKYRVDDTFNTIAQLVGQKCAKSLIFIVDS